MSHAAACVHNVGNWKKKKKQCCCTWHSLCVHVSFTVSPNIREWAFCDYQRGSLIWFNPTAHTHKHSASAISGFCFVSSDKGNDLATAATWALSLTPALLVSVYKTNSVPVMAVVREFYGTPVLWCVTDCAARTGWLTSKRWSKKEGQQTHADAVVSRRHR